MERRKQALDQFEIELLKEALKRTYKERFLFATSLYKKHMAAVAKAMITHKPLMSKYFDKSVL